MNQLKDLMKWLSDFLKKDIIYSIIYPQVSGEFGQRLIRASDIASEIDTEFVKDIVNSPNYIWTVNRSDPSKDYDFKRYNGFIPVWTFSNVSANETIEILFTPKYYNQFMVNKVIIPNTIPDLHKITIGGVELSPVTTGVSATGVYVPNTVNVVMSSLAIYIKAQSEEDEMTVSIPYLFVFVSDIL